MLDCVFYGRFDPSVCSDDDDDGMGDDIETQAVPAAVFGDAVASNMGALERLKAKK